MKTKRQLRAEAVERLWNTQLNTGNAVEKLAKAVGAHWNSDNTPASIGALEARLIYMLTDDSTTAEADNQPTSQPDAPKPPKNSEMGKCTVDSSSGHIDKYAKYAITLKQLCVIIAKCNGYMPVDVNGTLPPISVNKSDIEKPVELHEIITCSKCRKWTRHAPCSNPKFGTCRMRRATTKEDDFCSGGVLKDGC